MYTKYIILFFGILISVTSCKQADPNKQIDEGTVDNSVYSSKDIGWTMTIPKNWRVTTREETEASQKKGLDALEVMVDGDIEVAGLRNLIGFQKNKFNVFQSSSEPFEIEYPGEWEDNNALLKELLYDTYKSQGIKADSTATTIVKIDGLDFHTYGFTIYAPNGDVILNQVLYGRRINGFDFGVSLNYNNESDKKELLDAWLNSKFIKKK